VAWGHVSEDLVLRIKEFGWMLWNRLSSLLSFQVKSWKCSANRDRSGYRAQSWILPSVMEPSTEWSFSLEV